MEFWVAPAACTLPTAEQPLRVAEFDLLFTDHLRGVRRESETRAVFALEGRPDLSSDVASLTRRESECCSFFEFGVEPTEGGVNLVVTVPGAQTGVLDALVARAGNLVGTLVHTEQP